MSNTPERLKQSTTIVISTEEIVISEIEGRDKKIYDAGYYNGLKAAIDSNEKRGKQQNVSIVAIICVVVWFITAVIKNKYI